jgi:hypothetical protein
MAEGEREVADGGPTSRRPIVYGTMPEIEIGEDFDALPDDLLDAFEGAEDLTPPPAGPSPGPASRRAS